MIDEPYSLEFLDAVLRTETPALREVGLIVRATICAAAHGPRHTDATACTHAEMAHLLRIIADLWEDDRGDAPGDRAELRMVESLREAARNLDATATNAWISSTRDPLVQSLSAANEVPLWFSKRVAS